MFYPPCGSMRAVIKDWLVVMWSCCHRGPYVSNRHKDQCHRPEESCSVIYQRKATSFSFFNLSKRLFFPKNHQMSGLLYPRFVFKCCRKTASYVYNNISEGLALCQCFFFQPPLSLIKCLAHQMM